MKTGIELIEQERKEQIEKHGFSIEKDKESYKNGELIQAAEFCLEQAKKKIFGLKEETITWPKNWDPYFEQKIRDKSVIEQLTVCGAFYLAESDRSRDLEIYHRKARGISFKICDLFDLQDGY